VKKLFTTYFFVLCGILQTQTFLASPATPPNDSLAQRVTRIEQENKELRLKVEYLDKLYDKRFDDFTKWLGILIAVIVGGVILIGFNANSTARKQAIEELNSLQNKISSIDKKSDEISITLSSMEQQTEAFERLRQSQLGDNNG
jgi:type VI protein secretion system component VasK